MYAHSVVPVQVWINVDAKAALESCCFLYFTRAAVCKEEMRRNYVFEFAL